MTVTSSSTASLLKPLIFFSNEKGEVYHSKRVGGDSEADSLFPKHNNAVVASDDG